MSRSDPTVTEFENRLRIALDRFAEGLAQHLAPTTPDSGNASGGKVRPALSANGSTLDQPIAPRRLIALVQAGRYR
ncbi:hypothetical protein [Aureimonas phyllosphaerae]|uniref:Uncharacterized protein n=1 Tax=Aureimonas phyllosphaerae TaxID=1166078 RepID=A0A7W6BQN1_9HYPH|nr:hypothetical protein [Aureimonas phyllosphaerae]MBB3934475.1 hypothetical protein [Aureimonas phyllosphaerae]MBB3958309.1 hypothetical protein [Aureimonas phyllosphaerae]SFE95085.1 hypothetical protein SAMN05216566_101279 [Aureimonas phyllosphaerae]